MTPFVARPTQLLVVLALRYRRTIIVALHLAVVVVANYLAFLLRFDGSVPRDQMRVWLHSILFLVLVRGVVFVPFGVFYAFHHARFERVSFFQQLVDAL